MGIARPDGPYSMEMTAGAAWPAADEDTYGRRSEELADTHTQVSGAREQWESHRQAVFGGDAVWSGRAADAAVAEIDSRTTAMSTLQRQLRTAADQAKAATAAITDAKSQVADNVRMAQQVIAQVQTLDADGIDAFINQVVVSTYAANTEVVATAAARLTGPGNEKNDVPDKPMKAFGPIKDSPAPDEKKIEQPPLGPAAPLTDPSATRWQGPPPPGANNQTGFWAVDMSRPMDSSKPVPAPAPYRSAPPPCSVLEGPTTGVIQTKAGKSPQSGDAVGADIQNVYKFRISGTEFTGQTQMVQIDGKWYQAQWQKYNYEMNKIPVVTGSGDLGSIQVPILTESKKWTPVTWSDIMQENAKYGGETFTVPNAFGIPIKVVNATPQVTTPNVPIMTNGG